MTTLPTEMESTNSKTQLKVILFKGSENFLERIKEFIILQNKE